jgi:hypothetical protein
MSQTSKTNLTAVTPLVGVYDKHSASSELVHQGQRMQQLLILPRPQGFHVLEADASASQLVVQLLQ